MASLTTTNECRFGVITAATLNMLLMIGRLASLLDIDTVVITAGTNGVHSGPNDPHYHGNALDIRTHNFPTRDSKYRFVADLQAKLGPQFYAFVEDPDQPNEHIHVQVAKGKSWPEPALAMAPSRNAL